MSFSSSSSWLSAFLGRFVRPMMPSLRCPALSFCCNPLLSSDPITSFSVFLFSSFPSLLYLIIVPRRESPHYVAQPVSLSALDYYYVIVFLLPFCSISSFVLSSIQLTLSILCHIHILKASNLLISFFLVVHGFRSV